MKIPRHVRINKTTRLRWSIVLGMNLLYTIPRNSTITLISSKTVMKLISNHLPWFFLPPPMILWVMFSVLSVCQSVCSWGRLVTITHDTIGQSHTWEPPHVQTCSLWAPNHMGTPKGQLAFNWKPFFLFVQLHKCSLYVYGQGNGVFCRLLTYIVLCKDVWFRVLYYHKSAVFLLNLNH